MKRLLLISFLVITIAACDRPTVAQEEKDKSEFVNPFGYFTIENSGEEYSIKVDIPIDESTFAKYFYNGSYWNAVGLYEITPKGVNPETVDGGGFWCWAVQDNQEIICYQCLIPNPIQTEILNYQYSDQFLNIKNSFGGGIVCRIDDKHLWIISKRSSNDDHPSWGLNCYDRMEEDAFNEMISEHISQ